MNIASSAASAGCSARSTLEGVAAPLAYACVRAGRSTGAGPPAGAPDTGPFVAALLTICAAALGAALVGRWGDRRPRDPETGRWTRGGCVLARRERSASLRPAPSGAAAHKRGAADLSGCAATREWQRQPEAAGRSDCLYARAVLLE